MIVRAIVFVLALAAVGRAQSVPSSSLPPEYQPSEEPRVGPPPPVGLAPDDPRALRPGEQYVWIHKQGLMGVGYQLTEGEEKGLWRCRYLWKPEPPAAPAGDPYGFIPWLNQVRAGFGLPAVGHDPSLSQWAAVNNGQCLQAGQLNHFVLGPARYQNAAMGQPDAASVGQSWLNSPAHRATLLNPWIRLVGIAQNGPFWTLNAN